MFIRIETSSAVPIYRQIMEQIRDQTACGLLRAGQQIPPVRVLAEELAVNQNTILKVYNELCREGILTVERGSGTFVAQISEELKTEQCRQIVRGHLSTAAEKGASMNVGLEAMLEMLKEEYETRNREKNND